MNADHAEPVLSLTASSVGRPGARTGPRLETAPRAMERLRIAMLCPRLPYPLTKGEKIRAFHHLRHLARRHQVTLVCLVDDPSDLEHLDTLRAFLHRVEAVAINRRVARAKSLRALLTGRPLSLEYFACPTLARRLEEAVRSGKCDLILVYSSAMAQYVEGVREIPIVADFVDLDSEKWRQFAERAAPPMSWLFAREAARMRAYERHVGLDVHTVVLVSRHEADLYRAAAPEARVAVVPLVIDTEYFAPAPPPRPGLPPTIVFSGVMDYFPNVDAVRFFANEILPRIRREEPGTRFLVVGQRPAPAVRRLGKRPGIEVTGPVADVRPYLQQAHVSVAPLRVAQGMQTKILEAMAAGLPVVTTPKGFEGIEAAAGDDLVVEADAECFAHQVIDLLRDPARRQRMGKVARAFVEGRHRRERVMAELDAVLAALT
jgi:sugar transferase (PEP-CTERM/EpsH1 system associated)